MAQTNPWVHSMELEGRSEDTRPPSVLTPVEARQGLISGRVVLILMVSLTLAIIAGAIVYGVLV